MSPMMLTVGFPVASASPKPVEMVTSIPASPRLAKTCPEAAVAGAAQRSKSLMILDEPNNSGPFTVLHTV